uniref:Uncharacterized protein n=1 Tax=Anguilla anguilla TaxID=7936 RepID=A0A0E9PHL8_ANGAN
MESVIIEGDNIRLVIHFLFNSDS